MSAGASTGSTLITVNLTGGTSVFNDGAILLDTQTPSYTATLAANATYDSNLGANYYATTGATFPVSSAWGTIIPSTCTNNGNGQHAIATTCNVKLGAASSSPSYPASGNFVASSGTSNLICLAGPFKECDVTVMAVSTVSPGVQAITFNTRYAWDTLIPAHPTIPALVMQGGIEGKAFVSTATLSSWPIAYTVLGATTSSQIYFASCVTGNCIGYNRDSPGNILTGGTAITMFPSAEIVGTNGGTKNQAELAPNSIPFANGDSVVSAPTAQFASVGMRVLLDKTSPSSCGDLIYGCGESVGMDFDNLGAIPEDATITAHNTFPAAQAVKAFAYLGGAYQTGLSLATLPTSAAIRQYGGQAGGGTSHSAVIYQYYVPGPGYLFYPSLSMSTDNGTLRWSGPLASAYYTYPAEEVVPYSATPAFNPNIPLSTFMLSGSNTSSTLPAPDGNGAGTKCILFVHDSSSTAYTFAWPNNVIGYFVPGGIANKHSEQCFTYSASLAKWTPTSMGTANF